MRDAGHKTHQATPTELLLRRMAFHESVSNFQTVAVFLFALVAVGSSFLPRGQTLPFMPDAPWVALFAGCTAVVFFAGLYAMQRVTAWRVGGEARLLIRRNRANLNEIEKTLKLRIDDDDDTPKHSDRR